MKNLVFHAPIYRAYADWKKVQSAMSRPEEFLPVAKRLLDNYGGLAEAYRDAREIVTAYPQSDGAQVLSEMLEVGEEKQALAPGFLPALKKEVAALGKKFSIGTSDLGKVAGSSTAGNSSATRKPPTRSRNTSGRSRMLRPFLKNG